MSGNTTELGILIDCEEYEFIAFCVGKDLGYLRSFLNLMTQTFNQVQAVKDSLVKGIINTTVPDNQESRDTLQGIYHKLLRIEQRVFILRDIVQDLHRELPVSPQTELDTNSLV